MSTFLQPPLDFEVVREIWNKYELLGDNSILKVKVVLTRVRKGNVPQQEEAQSSAGQRYSVDFQQINVVLTGERGQPDTRKYTPQELQASIIKDDIRFRTVEQDWNEYVADDNTRIKIQPVIMKVAKSSKFDGKGDPIYSIELSLNLQVKPPTTQ